MDRHILYFDLGSPYSYLAVHRASLVLGRPVELEPVLLGAIFRLRGSGSWSQTPERDRQMAEVQRRAMAYGLPPIVWPDGWPRDGLQAMRAATWAKAQKSVDAFAREAFRRQFAEGRDVSGVEALAEVADAVGLAGAALRSALESPALKEALKSATARAWASGVRGVPTLRVGERLFYGDDRLDAAAAALGAEPASASGQRRFV